MKAKTHQISKLAFFFDIMSSGSEWTRPEKYVAGPDMPPLPPQLQLEDTSPEGILKSIKELPFFMEEQEDIGTDPESNVALEALRALSHEGTPDEIALNFKTQGNECYVEKKYQDAVQYYTRALEQKCDIKELNIACYINRAASNLELKNYRRCINDCKEALELDPKNAKALYRSAKAYMAIDRLDEAHTVLQYGLSVNPENTALKSLASQEQEKRARKKELQAAREKRENEKLTKKNHLKMALKAKHIKQMFSSQSGHTEENSAELGKVSLEDPMDPSSSLYFTVLFLYPLELESDLFEKVSEDSIIGDNLEVLFETSPPWFEKESSLSQLYALPNLNLYMQTATGGLAKVPKKKSLLSVLSMPSPKIPLIDDTVRIFIVPKSREDWLGTWNKEQALKLLTAE